MKLNLATKASERMLPRTESSSSSDAPTTPQISDHEERTPLSSTPLQSRPLEDLSCSHKLIPSVQALSNRHALDAKLPLHAAAERAGIHEMCALLKQPGIDPNARDEMGFTALQYAAFHGNLGGVEALIDDPRTDCRARSSIGATALDCAAMAGHVAVMQTLIKKGGVSAVGEIGKMRAIHLAAGQGHRDACELLIDHGEHINALDHQHNKPLHFAAARGHVDVMVMLLSRGAYPSVMNRRQKTPLHHAVEGRHTGAIRLLMAHGARADLPTDMQPAPMECTQDENLRALMADADLVSLSKLYGKQLEQPDPRRDEAIGLLRRLVLDNPPGEHTQKPPGGQT